LQGFVVPSRPGDAGYLHSNAGHLLSIRAFTPGQPPHGHQGRDRRYAERFRAAQLEALPGLLERHGLSPDSCPPAVLAVLLASVSRMVVMEQALGMSIGHAETLAFVEQQLKQLEG
jgi:hypothetical protein